jgi:hypothetical protein
MAVFGDLCTLSDVKAWLQTGQSPFPPTDDALLTRLITAVSVGIQTWLNRSLTQQDWIEQRDGPAGGSPRFDTVYQFSAQPVTSVAFVVVNNFTVPQIASVPPAPPGQPVISTFASRVGWLFTPTQLVIRGYSVPPLHGCVTIQYTAGFSPIPTDIAQAAIEWVVRKYRERTRIGERSKSIGGMETTSYETVTFTRRDITSDIQLLLEQYRKVTPTTGFLMQAPTQTDTATLVVI